MKVHHGEDRDRGMQVHERGVRGPSLIATSHGGRVPRWSFAPSMISATPRSLLDALNGQREDRLHRGSATINVQQLAGDEARLVSAEENYGVADVGWQAEAPHGRPAALVPVLDHLEQLGRQPAEEAVVAGARTGDGDRDALLGETDREITSQRLFRGFR